MFAVLAVAAVCLSPPVNGPVIAPYSPIGNYGGHWGVDYAADLGEEVKAPVAGLVTFAGSVAGMNTVTIQPIDGLKISVSYLASIEVGTGQRVVAGQIVGRAGVHDGVPAVHMSTRINGRYVDPATQMGCVQTEITRALRLLPPPQPYPRPRANRNPRRNIRSDPRRSSPRRRKRTPSVPPRSGAPHTGR